MTTTEQQLGDGVLGWCAWTWNATEGLLTDLSGVWTPQRIHTAQCFMNKDHHSPDPTCPCGIRGFYSMRQLTERLSVGLDDVYGLARLGGRLIPEPDVIRAERAVVLAVGCWHRQPGCPCRIAAELYGVPYYSRPHATLMWRAAEEHSMEPPKENGFVAYKDVIPNLRALVENQYGSITNERLTFQPELLQAARREAELSRSSRLIDLSPLTFSWFQVYDEHLLRSVAPFAQTDGATAWLLSHANIPSGSALGQDSDYLHLTLRLLLMTALRGQEQESAGLIYEHLRQSYRLGLAYAIPDALVADDLVDFNQSQTSTRVV